MDSKNLISLFLFILVLSPASGLAQEPPEGIGDTLSTMTTGAYALTSGSRGWSSIYQLPQSEFSVDDLDFFDDSADFSEVGLYALGLENLLNPQYGDIGLGTGTEAELLAAATNTLPWVWTPSTEGYGTNHGGTLPHNGIANVLEKVMGINGTSNVCQPELSIPFNTWGVPKDTLNKQTFATLSSLAGAGHLFLTAAERDPASEEKYIKIARGIGDMLLSSIVTPQEEGYGIHPSQLMDGDGMTIPVGMMPMHFLIQSNSPDTTACTDGGTIKMHENRKTWMAQAAVFLDELARTTGEDRYAEGSETVREGLLALAECDGTYKDYTRWEGSGTKKITCTPDDGSESYTPYPTNVTVAETKGFIIDTGMILYLLRLADPDIYETNERFRNAVHYLLDLEEKDVGSGYLTNGSPVRYASYSIDVTIRPFAQILMSNVFLRASCIEDDEEIEKRLQTQAYELIQAADTLVGSELDSKIANAISGDVGTNVLAASMAADNWKIITVGCADCTDGDGDGFIDGVCAGDTQKYDCNDTDASIHPGATETCNMIDDDCDGSMDEDFDGDGDGVSICAEVVDCNDGNDEVYPGADELTDDQDNDCNGKVDDAGFFVSVQTDQNEGIPNIDILVVDYGNPCANSFASPADNIEEIKLQCSTAGSCITDENGGCFVTLKKDGKYQTFAGVQPEGITGEPATYAIGKRVDILLFTDANQSGILVNDGNNIPEGGANPFTSNPYMLWGVILGTLIIGGIGIAYLYKIGKIPPMDISKWTGNKTPPAFPKESGNTILASAAIMKSPPKAGIKLPKLSASGIAGKLVTGKLPTPSKIGNFPPKKNEGFEKGRTKKVWKDV
ncbi:MAG: putative metal-binding motif-containing protein [archaeon]